MHTTLTALHSTLTPKKLTHHTQSNISMATGTKSVTIKTESFTLNLP